MDKHTQASKEYLDTLLKYFEDEISGEAYFWYCQLKGQSVRLMA
jgi:hypothetical protein